MSTRVPLALVALLSVAALTACGSGSSTYSVRDVERAFYRAGVPFQHEAGPAVANPYLQGAAQRPLLPRPARAAAGAHLEALLAALSSRTFAMELAYVFDSTRSAKAAVARYPLSKWLTSNHPVIRVELANVLVLAAASDAATARRVRAAVAALKAQR